MEDLDGALRRATEGRLSYDAGAGRLVVRVADGSGERSVAVGHEAVRNALQSALLAAGTRTSGPDPLTAGALALLAAYDTDAEAAERLVRRSAAQFAGTAAARRRRHG